MEVEVSSIPQRKNPVPDQPEKEEFAATFAKAHLDTLMSDYVILGFNRSAEPIELIEFYNIGNKESLAKLYDLFLVRAEQQIFVDILPPP